MPDNPDPLLDLALAISDGAPIDWTTTPGPRQAADEETLRCLRVIADIADVHHRLERSPHHTIADELQERAPHTDERHNLPTWGPLRLIERIGEGAYGEVYRAWDSRLDREVALKLLRRVDSQRAAGTSWIEEGRLLARVRHPNVITVYGADRIGDHSGVWMELVEGSTLAQVIAEQGPLPAGEIIRIGHDLASALDAVHQAGLLHRDVKAQNVMRAADSRVVLMDFGAGREGADSPGVAGTPLYLAPELLNDAPATVQSDIYSLGVLLHYIATGTFPASGRSLSEIRRIHLESKAVRLRDVRPDLPSALFDIVERATGADPLRRFESAGAVARACAAATVKARRRWLAPAAAAAAAVLIGLVLGGLPWGGTAPLNDAGTDAAAMVARRILADAPIDGVSSVSADGRYIARASGSNLALLDTKSGESRIVTRVSHPADQAESSSFAPDDEQVAYVWWSGADERYEIRLISIAGGEPRVVHSDPATRHVTAIAWLPGGDGLAASLQSVDGSTELVIVPAAGGAARSVHTSRGVQSGKIAVSPDGRFIAWSRQPDANVAARDVWVTSIADGRTAAVVSHPADDFAVDWTPDGRNLLFATDRTTGNPSLWRVALTDGVPVAPAALVRPEMGRSWPLRVTPSGTYFYGVSLSMEDVYVGTFDRAGGNVAPPAPIATTFVGSNRWPDWSRDGRWLAYTSRSAGGPNPIALTIAPAEGAARRRIPVPLDEFIRVRWSPDGRLILGAGRDLQGRVGLYQVDVRTGALTPLLITEGLPRQLDWSPDQNAVYYSLVGIDGGVMKLNLASRTSTKVLPGMVSFALSPDGRWLVGDLGDRDRGVARLMLASVDGETRELAQQLGLGAFTLGCAWTADSRQALCIKRPAKGPNEVWRYSTDGAEPQRLAAIQDMRHLRLHPDGRRFAFVAGTFKAELWATSLDRSF